MLSSALRILEYVLKGLNMLCGVFLNACMLPFTIGLQFSHHT